MLGLVPAQTATRASVVFTVTLPVLPARQRGTILSLTANSTVSTVGLQVDFLAGGYIRLRGSHIIQGLVYAPPATWASVVLTVNYLHALREMRRPMKMQAKSTASMGGPQVDFLGIVPAQAATRLFRSQLCVNK